MNKLLLNIISFFILLTLFSCDSENKNKKLNVLLIYMDDLRPELKNYGKKKVISPNIDRLAKMGIQFENAYCNVPVCGASRASMMTGIRPGKSYFLDYNTFIKKDKPDAITLVKLFKENGYKCISNGKIYHHLDDNINDWDEIYRPYAFDSNYMQLSPTDYWQTIWKDYQNKENKENYKLTDNGPAYECGNVDDYTYIDGIMTKKVINDIKKLKNSDKPFFLSAGFISPHLPFNSPKKYWDLYKKEDISLPYNNFIPENAPNISISNWPELRAYQGIPKKGPLNDSTALNLIHAYYSAVSYVDKLIGDILDELEKNNLTKNTLIVFVSDHGYNLSEHTQWAKFTNYQTSTKVPLILSVPGMKTKGEKTFALTELVDLYPTISEICGIQYPKNQIEGVSLLPILKNPNIEGKNYVFLKSGKGYSLVTRKYSYTEYLNPINNEIISKMLYNLEIDPDENINQSENKYYSNVVDSLHNILHNEFGDKIIN